MVFLFEDQLTEDRLELERAKGKVPFATPISGCLREGDRVDFYSWDDFHEVGRCPMPPLGFVIQPGIELEARCYRTGEMCRLETIWQPWKQKVYYAWFDKQGRRVSF